MNDYDIIEIDVCVDCLNWIANGTLPDDGVRDDINANSIDAITTAPGIDEGYRVEPVSGDDEGFFSHQSCDACRRRFGGRRYRAVMIAPIPNEEES
jgi:hypothetical protein